MVWALAGLIVVAVLGTGTALYYRAKSVATSADTAKAITENTEVLKDVNSLLVSLAARANAISDQEQTNAKTVSSSADAAAFLNASVRSDTSPRNVAKTVMSVARSSAPSKPVRGFVR